MNLRPAISEVTTKHLDTAAAILNALGGAANITTLAHCVTRLRIALADPNNVKEAELQSHPAVLGVLWRENLQIVVGPAAVKSLAAALSQLLDAHAGEAP